MRPFYSVYFNARMCHMKITVNDVPLLSMELEGQCSSRYPCNHLLLESGWATIKYEARPLKGELQLREDAYLNCKVELFDMDSPYEPLSTMAAFETQEEKVIPYVLHEDTFQVDVPYQLVGWTQSMKLNRFKKQQLMPPVQKKYNALITMMSNHDFSQFEDAFKEREDIMGVCYYLPEEEKQDRARSLQEVIMNCSEIVPLAATDRLEFAADNRLVRLIKLDGESALRVRNHETQEETTIDMWLHVKPGNHHLTII